MIIKYNIEVPKEYSAALLKLLMEQFNIIIVKRQLSIDGEASYVEAEIRY